MQYAELELMPSRMLSLSSPTQSFVVTLDVRVRHPILEALGTAKSALARPPLGQASVATAEGWRQSL